MGFSQAMWHWNINKVLLLLLDLIGQSNYFALLLVWRYSIENCSEWELSISTLSKAITLRIVYVVQTTVLRDELWSMTFIRVGIARLPQKWKTTGFRIVAFTKDDQNNMIYDALIHTPIFSNHNCHFWRWLINLIVLWSYYDCFRTLNVITQ